MTPPEPSLLPTRIERLPAVLARVGLSRSYVYAAVSRGAFPPPLKIGRASGWDSRAIDAWIDAQAGLGGGPP